MRPCTTRTLLLVGLHTASAPLLAGGAGGTSNRRSFTTAPPSLLQRGPSSSSASSSAQLGWCSPQLTTALRRCATLTGQAASKDGGVCIEALLPTSPIGCPIAALCRPDADGTATPLAVSLVAEGTVVRLRGRVQNLRVKGTKLCFIHLRQPLTDSIQVVVSSNNSSSNTNHAAADNDGSAAAQTLMDRVKRLTPESIVDVWGTLYATPKPVSSVSCNRIELHATDLTVVTLAEAPLPFPLADTNTKLDTRLDHRVIDMRTPSTGAIARLVSVVNNAFRTFMGETLGFMEIHTPKLIGTPSEGGSSVFELQYFDKRGFLAQSPQLYKQMMLMGDAQRVFEIGPVFRAEKSLSHRHLTEFVGLDAELVIHQHYTEVLNVLEATLVTILRALEQETVLTTLAVAGMATPPAPIVALLSQDTMQALGVGSWDTQVPSTDKYGAVVSRHDGPFPVLRLAFDDAVRLLMDARVLSAPVEDFNTPQEKQLGALIKERYGVDVYVIDRFPTSARPFYTMLLPGDKTRTCSYDMYLRGEEICSGAQRIHDPALLQERMHACGVNVALIQDYVNAFRYGAWPHGGFGLGLERIVLFFLGIPDIRMVSLFPRDPRRITP